MTRPDTILRFKKAAAALLCCLVFTLPAVAQPSTISMSFRNAALESVIEKLKEATGNDFVYQKEVLAGQSRVRSR